MCEIAGMVGFPPGVQEDFFASQNPGLSVYRSPQAALTQTLALSLGKETYVLSFQGTIYNREELCRELNLAAETDPELVLRCYLALGSRCVERFNGVFAFAIWEEGKGRLFLARDRVGVKPLFFTLAQGGLLFASKLHTILTSPGFRPRLGETGAAQLILLGPGRLPGSGVVEGIQELEPGCRGYFSQGKWQMERYWKLRDREHTESFADTVETVRDLVTDAIGRQMRTEKRLGTFLSGGLDSSIITALCAQDRSARGERLPTFSVDYEDSEKYFRANKFQPEGDNGYIQLMTDTFGTDHHWTVLGPEDLARQLEDATLARGLPGMGDVDFSLLAFAKAVRSQVEVALSGECADEIFGGYPWYRDPAVRSREGFPWAQNTRQRGQLLGGGLKLPAEDFVMDAYRRCCQESDILPGQPEEEKRMKEMVNLNFRYFMQTLLDRMSMYPQLETRVPFCDYRIAQYLYTVPWAYKDYQGREKGLLRQAMQGILPEPILFRKKSPYPKTFDPRYEELMERRLAPILADPQAPIWGLLDPAQVRKYLEDAAPWPWYGQLMRRPQTIAFFLQLNFWLEYYRIDFTF